MSNHIDKSLKWVPRRDQFSMTNNMRHTIKTTYASNRLYISVFNFTGAKIIKKVVSGTILPRFFYFFLWKGLFLMRPIRAKGVIRFL